ATLGAALRNSDRASLERQVSAGYVITSKNGFDTFSPAAAQAAANAPGVAFATGVRQERARVFGREQVMNGVDPAVAMVLHLNWTSGSDAVLGRLGADGAVLEKDYAHDHHASVGSRFEITTPAGRKIAFRVAAIQSPRTIDKLDPLLSKVVIARSAFDRAFPRPK